MPDIARTVTDQLTRFGQPCVVRFKQVGSASSAQAASNLNSVIHIGSRTTTVIGGVLTAAVNATMPPLSRGIQGANIIVGQRTYTVQSSFESLYLGQVYQTKLVLV